uniref:Uncharacterized protein n=1 Tax=Arundo donax TaxID=35708 RepID=A0A0A9AML6_ARUDO
MRTDRGQSHENKADLRMTRARIKQTDQIGADPATTRAAATRGTRTECAGEASGDGWLVGDRLPWCALL